MQFILVSKLNNVTFEVAEKELKKYKKDLKLSSYKVIHGGTTEIITYKNSDCSKVIDVNCHHNKKDNTYNLSIYELMESREIKVIKVNGDHFYTKINGTDPDIINHYNEYNLSCDNKENIQVKEIEFLYNNGGFTGLQERRVVYNFAYDNKLNCFQY